MDISHALAILSSEVPIRQSRKGEIQSTKNQQEKVLVFMKGTTQAPQCGFSRAVVQILQLQGVEKFATVNVLENEEIRNAIKEYTNWPTIPQVFIMGEFVGGCDIMISMHQSGELEKLLLEKGVAKPLEDSKTENQEAKDK
jgi:monothiol glutaredoxin